MTNVLKTTKVADLIQQGRLDRLEQARRRAAFAAVLAEAIVRNAAKKTA